MKETSATETLPLNEARCPICTTLLTKAYAKVGRGSLNEMDFERLRKGAHIEIGTETKCRKCKQIIKKTIETI